MRNIRQNKTAHLMTRKQWRVRKRLRPHNSLLGHAPMIWRLPIRPLLLNLQFFPIVPCGLLGDPWVPNDRGGVYAGKMLQLRPFVFDFLFLFFFLRTSCKDLLIYKLVIKPTIKERYEYNYLERIWFHILKTLGRKIFLQINESFVKFRPDCQVIPWRQVMPPSVSGELANCKAWDRQHLRFPSQ
jgi:hypothetical protein